METGPLVLWELGFTSVPPVAWNERTGNGAAGWSLAYRESDRSSGRCTAPRPCRQPSSRRAPGTTGRCPRRRLGHSLAAARSRCQPRHRSSRSAMAQADRPDRGLPRRRERNLHEDPGAATRLALHRHCAAASCARSCIPASPKQPERRGALLRAPYPLQDMAGFGTPTAHDAVVERRTPHPLTACPALQAYSGDRRSRLT